MTNARTIIKKIIQPFAYTQYLLSKNRYKPGGLKEGVSAVVVAKNESYCLPLALESLVGFADEVICIDNGSTDNTLTKMKKFKDEFSDKVIVEVIEAPGKLLGDCRNIGLEHSHFTWHLRWDADMVFRQRVGIHNTAWLKEQVRKIKTPAAIKLSRINLSGDFHHVSKLYDVVDEGEYFLVRKNKRLVYKEREKFDLLPIPLFYKLKEIPQPIIFHLRQIKSLERILYRNEYFNWRKQVLNSKTNIDFETFRKEWELKMFGTNNHDSVLYRFHKKFVFLNSKQFDIKQYGLFPEQIQKAIDEGNERFNFVYENGRAVSRKDKEDNFLGNYIPTKEDLEWNLDEHLESVLPGKRHLYS